MFKLSSEASLDGYITVENKFIVEYMPYADGDYVKVYLYGLSLAARKSDPDDTVARLARRLDLDPATVDAAIDYWTEHGLMSRIGDDICYLSLRSVRPKIKKFDVDKYREFNIQAQRYIAARQISPNEYHEYYTLMERLNIEWQAMTLIVKYCVDQKGDNVLSSYILSVARNLAEDGYRTESEVGDRLEEYGVYYNDVCAVLGAMPSGGKRPDHEASKLYKKWRKEYKLENDVILHVAATVKRGGMATLDYKLTQYRELGLTTSERIDAYEQERSAMYKLAKSINKALGLFYDNVDPEISEYIKPWLDMGFESGAIVAIAGYCMRSGHKTLGDLDAYVRDFFAAGALTQKQVEAHIAHDNRHDADIESLMQSLSVKGAIRPVHRAFYEAWADKWNLPKDLIDYAAVLALTKTNPFAYMNALLSAWHDAGVKTVAEAKQRGSTDGGSNAAPVNASVREKYTAEQLNALVISLDEEE